MKSTLLRRICADETGATAIEYGLIVSLIFIAIMGSIGLFADKSIAMWGNVSEKQSAAVAPAAGN